VSSDKKNLNSTHGRKELLYQTIDFVKVAAKKN
jgi:hypothetical protein